MAMEGDALRFTTFEQLEKRFLYVATPASPRADSLGSLFDKTERQIIIDRLTNLDPSVRGNLQTKLNTGMGAFDGALLSYMRTRSGPNFFFDPADVSDIGDFINSKSISVADQVTHANAVTDSHLFPDQGGAGTYTVDLPDVINWIAPGGSTNPEFLHTMNRHEYWLDIAWASASTNDPKYAAEIEYELASWSQAYPTMAVPSAWSASDQQGWLLDTSLRGESWSWAYWSFLHHDDFTGAENSLFIYKLLQTADFLNKNAISTDDFDSNKTIVLGKALLYLGQMFPEADNAASWEVTARNLLFKCLDAQIYPDGSHVEQSPGYTFNVSNDLLDAYQIDQRNGVAWPTDKKNKLTAMIDSYWQFNSPNGRRPAIGDSYRNNSLSLFTKPDLILGTSRWPASKPQARDVWIAGMDAVTPHLNNSVPTTLGERGKTFAMPDSGNYIMRSGSDRNARQIIFDAGPKGGSHGHYDLLNFELAGYGRNLISDPGPYKYDTSANRKYVVSTKAHNTINVDGGNHAALEGSGNSDIIVSQWKTGTNFAQVTATHRGYKSLAGSPTLTRSVWFDLDGTMLVVDWAQGGATHNYQVSFNLQTEGNNSNVVVDADNLYARTKYPSGGNVKIESIRNEDGETADKGALTFVTNTSGGDYMDDAYRFTLNQSGKFVVFATLITTYNGTNPTTTTARLLNAPTEGGVLRVELTKDGKSQVVEFIQPPLSPLNSTAKSRGTYNDIVFDSSDRLHMVYADRDTGSLMYALRDAAGKWSAPSTILTQASSDPNGGYQFVSLALDNSGNPAVAFFDGWNGDLKYAARSSKIGKWSSVTVDSKGSTGLYPSLAFSRDNTATISFYNRTNKDLMLATSSGGKFSIKPIDTSGDVGRFSNLLLDPNRASLTRWAIGYEDTANGDYKYAIEGDFAGGTKANGFTNYLVENLPDAGGYVSLAFRKTSSKTKPWQPAMSYYNADQSELRYAASSDAGATWSAQSVASAKIQGLYTNLFFDIAGKPNIYYFNRTANEAVRAILDGASWTFTDLRPGGREIHLSRNSKGQTAYSNLNEATGELTVHGV